MPLIFVVETESMLDAEWGRSDEWFVLSLAIEGCLFEFVQRNHGLGRN